jgi:hypothetical protein
VATAPVQHGDSAGQGGRGWSSPGCLALDMAVGGSGAAVFPYSSGALAVVRLSGVVLEQGELEGEVRRVGNRRKTVGERRSLGLRR